MYDPEMVFHPRLAKECGLKADPPFAPKLPCNEEELKQHNQGGAKTTWKVINNLQSQFNRIVDTEQWERNEYVLVTNNLDTLDQRAARNGFSIRIRYPLIKVDGRLVISRFDLTIKTLFPTGSNVVSFRQTRREWEVPLDSLKPDIGKMIAEHAGSRPALPAFFTQGGIKDEELYVESVGASLRTSFPSFEIIKRCNKVIVPEFHHTIDKNIFMTPYCDAVTGQDDEMEAEFIGFHGIEPGELSGSEYDKLMRKSMQTLERTIINSDPANIQRNLTSKAGRARNALEVVYGPENNFALTKNFNMEQRVEQASHFALSQRITPKDVRLDNIWHNVGHLYAISEMEQVPQENPFQHYKYQQM